MQVLNRRIRRRGQDRAARHIQGAVVLPQAGECEWPAVTELDVPGIFLAVVLVLGPFVIAVRRDQDAAPLERLPEARLLVRVFGPGVEQGVFREVLRPERHKPPAGVEQPPLTVDVRHRQDVLCGRDVVAGRDIARLVLGLDQVEGLVHLGPCVMEREAAAHRLKPDEKTPNRCR